MFNIGMFPYTMLATTPLFYSNDWPKRLVNYFTKSKYKSSFEIKALSSHCVYDKETIKTESDVKTKNISKKTTILSFYHKAFVLFTIFYLTEQAILPFSHSITKVSQFKKKIYLS
jgi:vitamin K-dependent gamma-carboxylase